MIGSVVLQNVGPAPRMEMTLAPRLNVITGENGLGKSFLLETMWWALTRTWLQEVNPAIGAGYAPRPRSPMSAAEISFELEIEGGARCESSAYAARDPSWPRDPSSAAPQGLVLYALANGGFAVWDSARNAGRSGGSLAWVLTAEQVWEGSRVQQEGKQAVVCNGLLADVSSWVRERGVDGKRMGDVLARLSPSLSPLGSGGDDGAGGLRISAELTRLSVNDARDVPMIEVGAGGGSGGGQPVPIVMASQAVRRIAALAYMMSWAWREHVIATRQLGVPPVARMVLLLDEVEAHLHPRWQRAIAPALLECARVVTGEEEAQLQLIVTTHSPLVLASLEPCFEEERDRLFTLERRRAWDFGVAPEDGVVVREQAWAKQGDAVNWLVSEAFGLRQARSLEAERAIEAAGAWMREEWSALPAHLASRRQIHAELQRTLPGHDEFWPRWIIEQGAPSPRPGAASRKAASARRKTASSGREAAAGRAAGRTAGRTAGRAAGKGGGKRAGAAGKAKTVQGVERKLEAESAKPLQVMRAKPLEKRGRTASTRLAGNRPLEARLAAARRPKGGRERNLSGRRAGSLGVSGIRTMR